MFEIESAALSHLGRKRKNNEDSFAVFEPEDAQELDASGCLYIVADGVGGAAQGERASRYAVQKVLYEYYHHPEQLPGERLRRAMQLAGNEIYAFADESLRGRMATTMVAAAIHDSVLTIANVGDSRAYLLRNGEVRQISRDHSLVGEMLRDGTITEEESLRSKIKNSLTRSLGGEEDVHVDIFPDLPLQTGDRILLSTDGLTRYTLRQDIHSLIAEGSPEDVVNCVVKYANHAGGADNITAILIDIGNPAPSLQPVKQKVHGAEPTLVTWEDMPTESFPVRSSKRRSSRQDYQQYLPWTSLAILFLITLILMGLALKKIQTDSTKVSFTQTALAVLSSANTAIVGVSSSDDKPLSTSNQSQTASPNPTMTETTQPTPTITPETPSPADETGICVGKITSVLSIFFPGFDLEYNPDETYYIVRCENYELFTGCDTEKIADHDDVKLGDFIMIPGITNKLDCESKKLFFIEKNIKKPDSDN